MPNIKFNCSGRTNLLTFLKFLINQSTGQSGRLWCVGRCFIAVLLGTKAWSNKIQIASSSDAAVDSHAAPWDCGIAWYDNGLSYDDGPVHYHDDVVVT